MKLVPYNGKLGGYYKRTSNYALIKEFMESGLKCAEIEDFPQSTANICASSMRATIKRYNLFNVQAVSRNGRVFLMRGEI